MLSDTCVASLTFSSTFRLVRGCESSPSSIGPMSVVFVKQVHIVSR